MDTAQMALANLLVGNPIDSAGLEFTGLGPTLLLEQASCIAWTGGTMSASLILPDGVRRPVPSHRPVLLADRSVLQFGACEAGFRSWFAISGGLQADALLKSRSLHLAAECGPPRIVVDSELGLGPEAEPIRQRMEQSLMRDPQAYELAPDGVGQGFWMRSTRWALPSSVPLSWPLIELSCLPGRHLGLLDDASQQALVQTAWRVSAQSSRQGLGLEGTAIPSQGMPSLQSEPVREGTVQLPPAGRPFVLLAEHQSTGGYPRVLEVIGAMRPELAQAGPGSRIVFKLIGMEEADALSLLREQELQARSRAVRERLGQE